MYKLAAFLLFIFFSAVNLFSQIDTSVSVAFDFNDHEIKEKDNKIIPRSVGVTLTTDRFGNEKSALYLHGHDRSYLNLGTSDLMKTDRLTISIWVNLDGIVYAGKGCETNPIISTKNGQGDDFHTAYGLYYDFNGKRYGTTNAKDSTMQVNVMSEYEKSFNKWYHFVITMDEHHFAYFINGKLRERVPKTFQTKYLKGDSVMVGNGASKKNDRWSQGVFDDIQFFNRVLSDKEIDDLYHAPNPNRFKNILNEVMKYAIILLVIIGIIIFFIIRGKRALKKQKEQLELTNRISELELKVVKSQMNPHFTSNCLAAIQELIYAENFKKAAQYLAKFSFFLRQILNFSDKTFITLEEELTIIKLNIELEQLRFKDDFEFKLVVSDEIDVNNVLIPSLITQPFIENAIWHGLLPLKGIRKACLTINVIDKNGIIFIEIEDNGVGRVSSIRSENSKGTKLVMDKIESINKLTNGNDYKLEIVDMVDAGNKPRGTKIILQLKDLTE